MWLLLEYGSCSFYFELFRIIFLNFSDKVRISMPIISRMIDILQIDLFEKTIQTSTHVNDYRKIVHM